MLTEAQKIAISVAYAVIVVYYCIMLCAVWLRPSLQRFWLFKPRWRGGVRASRGGVTAQAFFAFALAAFGFLRMDGHSYSSYFGVVFFMTAVIAIAAFIVDADSQINGPP